MQRMSCGVTSYERGTLPPHSHACVDPADVKLLYGKEERDMADEEKITEEVEVEAPVSAICNNAEELAADLVDDDSEIKPVEGFFLTSQRWH